MKKLKQVLQKVNVRQLQKELQEQKNVAAELHLQAEGLRSSLNHAADLNAQLGAAFETSHRIINRRNAEIADLSYKLQAVEKDREQSARTLLVAAQGMAIERDELLTRASRLDMRITGLGFDPNTDF